MGMRDLERAVLREARAVLCNPKLRLKDILEWSTGDLGPQEGETIFRVPLGVNVAVKHEHDRRPMREEA